MERTIQRCTIHSASKSSKSCTLDLLLHFLSQILVCHLRRHILQSALFFTKLSIMLLILRVFCSVRRDAWYWFTQLLIAVNGVFYIVFFFIPIFLCNPRSKIWNPEEDGHCLSASQLYLASAIFNMLSDMAMLSVPVYLIWSLQMSTRRKIGACAVFLTGGL